LTASLLCASATRRFASATRLARSSVCDGPGDGECAVRAVGVDAGLGDATVGDAIADVEVEADGAPFFIAAIFAAISALFWAMRSAAAWYKRGRHSGKVVVENALTEGPGDAALGVF
jgi:hypothetical protein